MEIRQRVVARDAGDAGDQQRQRRLGNVIGAVVHRIIVDDACPKTKCRRLQKQSQPVQTDSSRELSIEPVWVVISFVAPRHQAKRHQNRASQTAEGSGILPGWCRPRQPRCRPIGHSPIGPPPFRLTEISPEAPPFVRTN